MRDGATDRRMAHHLLVPSEDDYRTTAGPTLKAGPPLDATAGSSLRPSTEAYRNNPIADILPIDIPYRGIRTGVRCGSMRAEFKEEAMRDLMKRVTAAVLVLASVTTAALGISACC